MQVVTLSLRLLPPLTTGKLLKQSLLLVIQCPLLSQKHLMLSAGCFFLPHQCFLLANHGLLLPIGFFLVWRDSLLQASLLCFLSICDFPLPQRDLLVPHCHFPLPQQNLLLSYVCLVLPISPVVEGIFSTLRI